MYRATAKIADLSEIVRTLTDEKKHALAQIDVLEETKRQMKGRIAVQERQVTELAEKAEPEYILLIIRDRKKKVSELMSQIQSLDDELRQAKDKAAQMENRVAEMIKTTETEYGRCYPWCGRGEKTKEQIRALEDQKQQTEDELKRSVEAGYPLQRIMADRKAKANELEGQIRSVEEQKKQAEDEVGQKKAQIEGLQSQVQALDQGKKKAEDEAEGEKKRLEELSQDLREK